MPGPGGEKSRDDYAALLSRSYAAAAPTPAPFYDVAAGRLLVPDFVPLAEQRLLLAHEIAHAIADQRFGLRRAMGLGLDGRRLLDGDAQRARAALIEGDATLTALTTIDPRETFLGPNALATLLERMRAAPTPGLPLWLATLSRFVHADGLRFAAAARAGSPWSAVDALWTDPPASTEQVLHPESYYACDEPLPIAEDVFPTLPDFGRPTASDVLGELVARAWLATAVPPEMAARAAAGWGGDRAALYTRAATTRGRRGRRGAATAALAHGLGRQRRSRRLRRGRPRRPGADGPGPARPTSMTRTAPSFRPGPEPAPPSSGGPTRWRCCSTSPTVVAGDRRADRRPRRARTGPTKRAGEATAPRPRGGRPRPAAPPGCPRRDRAAAPR